MKARDLNGLRWRKRNNRGDGRSDFTVPGWNRPLRTTAGRNTLSVSLWRRLMGGNQKPLLGEGIYPLALHKMK